MTSEKKSSQSRILISVLGVIGLLLVALIVKGQLEQRSSQAKKHGSIASADSTADTATPTPSDPVSAKVAAQNARSAVPPAPPPSVFPQNIDTASYIAQRFPNQVTPQIVKLPAFTEEDKERKAREMFPEYARMQEQAEAEAERAKLAAGK
ncbi:MAG TPA: hypothetical protein VGF76_08350 [Polyangiaceae bacterium]|jgi:hypothetical protein|nr:hypothetical protein [Polyangiaceae bacterium]